MITYSQILLPSLNTLGPAVLAVVTIIATAVLARTGRTVATVAVTSEIPTSPLNSPPATRIDPS